MNGLKLNDFFCGAGGMGLGFKQEGWETVGAYDFDKYAVDSYRYNVDTIVEKADITEMKGSDVEYADVWTFGFPCQDISVAGKQAGMIQGQTRSGLFYEVMRLLDEVQNKPKVIVAENVKALKKLLPTIKEEYAKAGYIMYVKLFNSKFWGVPQNRERYFVVGVRKDIDKGYFRFPKQDETNVPKLSSILESEVDEKFYISDEKAKKIIEQAMKRVELKGTNSCVTHDRVEKRKNGRRAKEGEAEMFTLTSQDMHGVIQHGTCIDPRQASIDGYRIYNETSPTLTGTCYKEPKLAVIGRLDMKGQDNTRRVYDREGISPTLTTSEGGHRQPKILETYFAYEKGMKITKQTDLSQTLLGRDYKGPSAHQPTTLIVETPKFRVRKLTPREYARLQGFPDSYEFVCSNSQMYKQFGNAVTVNVSRVISKSIREFLNE